MGDKKSNRLIAEQVKKQAKVFQAVIDLADKLEKIDSVDRALKEGAVSLSKLEKTISEAKDHLEDVRKQAKNISSENDRLTKNAKETLKSAEIEASDILAKAKVDADKIKDTSVKESADLIKRTEAAMATLDLKKKDKEKELDEIQAAIVTANNDLSKIKVKLKGAMDKAFKEIQGL